jgi:hypothetical protein
MTIMSKREVGWVGEGVVRYGRSDILFIEQKGVYMTHIKKKVFLENYSKFCQVRETCAAIGLGKSTFYRWLKEDKVFQDAWYALKKEIEQELLERHEKNIDDIAFNPNVPPQTRLLGSFFKAKKLDPSYRDSYTQKVNVGNVVIQLNIPDYDDSLMEKGNIIDGEVKELDESS